MNHKSGRPYFPVLYLILPIVIASAFAVPTADSVLRSLGVEATGGAKVLAVVIAGLLICGAILVVLLGVRRVGKD